MNIAARIPKIIVVGSFMMDLVVRTNRLPSDGETVIGSSFQRFPGGKGANQAVAAARMGASVIMAGKLGNDKFGSEILDTLAKEDIDTLNILMDEFSPTGVGSITVDSKGRNRIVVVPGANMHYGVQELCHIESLIKESDILLMQLEMDVEMVEQATILAAKHSVPVILDPAPAQPLSETILQRVTYFTPNETEAKLLTGYKVIDVPTAKKAAHVLVEKGVQNVIITLGGQGALVANKHEMSYIPAFSVIPVDTVAAGDGFNGALAVGIAEGKTLTDASFFANAAGALTITKSGAIPSLPTKEEVMRFLEEYPTTQMPTTRDSRGSVEGSS